LRIDHSYVHRLCTIFGIPLHTSQSRELPSCTNGANDHGDFTPTMNKQVTFMQRRTCTSLDRFSAMPQAARNPPLSVKRTKNEAARSWHDLYLRAKFVRSRKQKCSIDRPLSSIDRPMSTIDRPNERHGWSSHPRSACHRGGFMPTANRNFSQQSMCVETWQTKWSHQHAQYLRASSSTIRAIWPKSWKARVLGLRVGRRET